MSQGDAVRQVLAQVTDGLSSLTLTAAARGASTWRLRTATLASSKASGTWMTESSEGAGVAAPPGAGAWRGVSDDV